MDPLKCCPFLVPSADPTQGPNPNKRAKTSHSHLDSLRLVNANVPNYTEAYLAQANMPSSSSSKSNSGVVITIPDHCAVMRSIRGCVGVEALHAWFEAFVLMQKPLALVPRRSKAARMRALADTTAGGEGGADENSSASVTNAGTEQSTEGIGLIEDEVGLVKRSGLSETELLQMRIRFSNAVHDLQACGLIKLRPGGRLVSRECFTWMATD